MVVTTTAPKENDHHSWRGGDQRTLRSRDFWRSDRDFLKPIVRAVLQEVLEGEMTEGRGQGRAGGRRGYRSGVLNALPSDLDGKFELRVPRVRAVNGNTSHGQVNTSGLRSSTPITEADPATPLAPTPESLETILPSVFPHTLRECVLGH